MNAAQLNHYSAKMAILNKSLHCCLQKKSFESNTEIIHNLTVLIDMLKPCFPLNVSDATVFRYVWDINENTPVCSTPPPDSCKTSLSINNVVFAALMVVIMVVAVLGNIIVFTVVYKTFSLRRLFTYRFIASLAVSDFMVAVFLIPVKIDSALRNGNLCTNLALCHYYLTLDNISFVASITNLFVITADRLFAIVKPYVYQNFMTSQKTRFLIIAVWLYAITIGALTNVNWDDKPGKADGYQCWNQNKIYVTVVYILVFYLPSILMGVAQGKMLIIALQHSRQMKLDLETKERFESEQELGEATDSTAMHKKQVMLRFKKVLREYRPVKIVLVVYGTFVICWLPVSVISLAHAWGTDSVILENWQVSVFVEFLPVLNSTFNFFIYSMMNRQFRKACKKLFVNLWARLR